MPVVSVIIPAFDRTWGLKNAVESALAQTLADIEVLVIDDGSPDADLVPGALSGVGDARLRIVRHDVNRGASAARNTGARLAAAPVLAFLDSDDTWGPDKLSRQMEALSQAPSDCCLVSTAVRVLPRDRLHDAPCPPPPETTAALLAENLVGTTSCVMIRAEALAAVGGFDESLPSCQDWDLWVRLSRVGRFAHISEPLTVHNRHGQTITSGADGSIRGHRLFMHKHAQAIAALSRRDRARHYRTLCLAFLSKRAWPDALTCIARAVTAQPSAAVVLGQAIGGRLADKLRRAVANW